MPSARCTAITARGWPCQAWAVRGSDPPRCTAHGGRPAHGGRAAHGPSTPPGDARAADPGPYAQGQLDLGIAPPPAPPSTSPPAMGEPAADPPPPASASTLEGQIEELNRRIAGLGRYIDAHTAELAPGDLVRLLDLHSKMMGRVTRMRQARKSLEGGQGEGLAAAINRALDAISKEWGIKL